MKISKSKYKGTSHNPEAVFDLSTSSSSNDVNNSKPNTKVSAASQTKSTLTNAFNALFGRSRSSTPEKKIAVTKSDEQARSSKKPVIIGLNTTVSLSAPQANSPEVFTTSVEHISGTFTGSHTNQNLSQSLSQILESDGSRPTSTLTVPHTLRPRSSSLSVVNTETRSLCNSPRDSLAGSVILKEGYLNKKADTYQGSTIGLGRGWKVYRVVLKGAKLYFYKPPTENEIKSIFPLSRKGRPLTIASESVEISPKKTTASPRSSSKGLKLASASFTSPTRALIFETSSDNSDSFLSPVYNPGSSSLASRYYFGECFTEVDPINFRFKRYVCLLIFEDVLVICKRKWVKQHRNSLFDAVNDAFRFTNGGGVHIDSFIQDEERAAQSGKGYYTKWKHGTTYRLDSIDVIEASSTSFTRPSDKQQYNSNRTSIFSHSNSSVASIDLDHSGSNIQAMQIFVGGPNAARRLFVAKAEEQQTWIIKFNMAKSSLSRKSAKLRRSEDHLNSSFNLSRTNLSSTSLHRDESKLRSQKSDPVIRGRLYWGTQMHPELITSRVSGEKSDVGTIIGGSIDSLIHELLFQNTESQESNFYNCSQFINAFLTTFTCFTTPAHLVKELRRCAMMGIPEELKVVVNAEDLSILNRLQKILTVWITEFNINIDQETLESIETVAVDLLTKDPNFIMEQFKSLLQPLKRKSDSLSLRNSLCISLPTIHEGSHLNHLALDFASLNRSGLSPTIFLKISPEDFAQELYVFHTRCKARVDSQTLSLKRLLPIATSTTDSPATVQNTPSMSLASVFLFTVSDPHFLTKLVYNHLVTNAQSMHPSRRSTILVHWIRVAEASKALGDMVSWIAIALAICSPIVVRLRETWKGIDKRMYYKVVHEWVPALFASGLYTSDIPIIPDTKVVLAELAISPSSAHQISYFGSIRVILDRIDKNVPSLIPGTSIINFRKYQDIYDIINYTQMTWNHFLRNCKTKDTLSGTSSLQNYFEHLLLTEDVALDFDFTQGFSSSLDCEPPVNIRYLQGSNDKPIPHNPASYIPLKFVPIHLEQTSFLNMLACIEPFESNLAHRSKEHQPATPTEDHRPSLNIPARHRLDTSTGIFKGISSASQLARKRTQSMPSKQFSKSIDSDKGSWWGLIQKPNGQPSPLYTQDTAEYVDRQECFLLTDNGELIFTICQIQTTDERSTFNLAIKGGLIDRLIDVLLFGINQKEISLIDVSGEAFIFDESEEAVFDEKGYNSYFFMAFRSFLNPVDLLTKFHQRYVEGESDPITPISESHSTIVYSPDIRVSVLKAIEYWIRNHLHDFIDSLELKDNVITFFNEIINEEVSYAGYNIERKQPPSEVEANVKSILNYLAYSSLIPISILNQYKLNGFLSQQEIQAPYQSPENPSQFESIFGCSPSLIEEDFDSAISENTDVSIPSVDDMLPEQVVSALNECALELSSRISLQDWVYTINDLEAQCLNPLAWYPKKNLHSAFEDETTISDIFMALDNCRHAVSNASVPTTNHSLLSSLPSSISSFYHLRETIKQWVISEIVSFSIDSNLRASRIVKFVNAVSLCHTEMSSYGIEKLQIFSNKFLVDSAKSQVAIPSFVERAIISGLIAPESRVFTKAWNDAAKTLGKSTDSIQAFLTHQLSKNAQPTLSTNCINAPIKLAGLIPCIGWVIENVLDMIYNIPDHLFSSKRMLNFEKRTLIYELIQSFVQWPLSCSKSNNYDSVNMMFLLSRHILPNNPELGVIREFALKENSKFKVPSGGHSNGTAQNRKVFSKLVHFEQEKLKRDFREREKLEREVRDRQLDIQRRINEEARLKEKRIKEQQQRKAKTKELEKMTNLFKSVHSSNSTNSQAQADDPTSKTPTNTRALTATRSKNTSSPLSNDSTSDLLTKLPAARPSLAINLINCATTIEYSRTKRDHVFKIVSEEGCQYLLQAIDRQDMLSWVKAITDAAKEGAARRFTVLVEDARKEMIIQNSERSSNSATDVISTENSQTPKERSSVFGIELSLLMKCEDGSYCLPVLIEKCLQEVEERGLYEVGIYRISGMASAIEQLRQSFNKDSEAVDLSSEEWRDINVISGVLKQWLRELPEPVLTFDLYHDFISAAVAEDYDTRLIGIKNHVMALPKSNYLLLKRLIEHLEMVTDYEDVNHMYASNLAIVFGPTLIRPPPGPLCFATSMANLGQQQALVKNLILQYHWIFDVEKEVEQQSKPKQHFLGTLEEECETLEDIHEFNRESTYR